MGKLRYQLQLSFGFYLAFSTHVYVFPRTVLSSYFAHSSVHSRSIDPFLVTETTGCGICQDYIISYVIHYTLSVLLSVCAKTYSVTEEGEGRIKEVKDTG